MACNRLGKLLFNRSILFLCDMQEKFRPTIQYFPQIVEVSARMLSAAKILDMPIIVTEQYPKGLGSTVPELDIKDIPVIAKTRFSMMVSEVENKLKEHPDVNSVVLCGIEAHACIQQTVLDLLEKDYQVHVVVDACSSRSMVDRMYAFNRIKEAGAFLTTSESALLSLCQDAKHPKFKEIQRLITHPAPDSGLLPMQPAHL
ncbi:isochorismatase domain-containing protein 2 [Octopus sinensis]|uniref:Isochorismatase domain-containing protein 2 n=1 Tax=Octopus sinensis TaxID=2607531 RepID=A0A6P7SDL9_9MOLL|nr:isochorismatase domain-containing protein 2 [Octopus sinensis]